MNSRRRLTACFFGIRYDAFYLGLSFDCLPAFATSFAMFNLEHLDALLLSN